MEKLYEINPEFEVKDKQKVEFIQTLTSQFRFLELTSLNRELDKFQPPCPDSPWRIRQPYWSSRSYRIAETAALGKNASKTTGWNVKVVEFWVTYEFCMQSTKNRNVRWWRVDNKTKEILAIEPRIWMGKRTMEMSVLFLYKKTKFRALTLRKNKSYLKFSSSIAKNGITFKSSRLQEVYPNRISVWIIKGMKK